MFANYGVINFYYSIMELSLVLAKVFTETTMFFLAVGPKGGLYLQSSKYFLSFRARQTAGFFDCF